MEQNNKVLLLAAMIVLVAIVSFQFGGVTGQVVDDDAGIEVEVLEDSVVFQSGQYGVKDSTRKAVTVVVTVPRGAEVGDHYDVYRVGASTQDRRVPSLGGRLSSTTQSSTETLWIGQEIADDFGAGEYYVRVYDDNKRNSFDSNTFELVVEELNEGGWTNY